MVAPGRLGGQELLTSFTTDIGELALRPGTGGVFTVAIDDEVVWDRKVDGGFPEIGKLKRLVRDRVAPGRDLGHTDRAAEPAPTGDRSTGASTSRAGASSDVHRRRDAGRVAEAVEASRPSGRRAPNATRRPAGPATSRPASRGGAGSRPGSLGGARRRDPRSAPADDPAAGRTGAPADRRAERPAQRVPCPYAPQDLLGLVLQDDRLGRDPAQDGVLLGRRSARHGYCDRPCPPSAGRATSTRSRPAGGEPCRRRRSSRRSASAIPGLYVGRLQRASSLVGGWVGLAVEEALEHQIGTPVAGIDPTEQGHGGAQLLSVDATEDLGGRPSRRVPPPSARHRSGAVRAPDELRYASCLGARGDREVPGGGAAARDPRSGGTRTTSSGCPCDRAAAPPAPRAYVPPWSWARTKRSRSKADMGPNLRRRLDRVEMMGEPGGGRGPTLEEMPRPCCRPWAS